MKFSIATKPITVASSMKPMTIDQIGAAYEELICSYMELTDTQRNLDEVCNVMDNINLSMQMLKTGGVDAIKILNIDKSLENLVGIHESRLTIESTLESFDQTSKAALDKFWEWVNKIITFFKGLVSKITQMWTRYHDDDIVNLLNLLKDEQLNSIKEKILQSGDKVGNISYQDNSFAIHAGNFIDPNDASAVKKFDSTISDFLNLLDDCNSMLSQIKEGAESGWLPGDVLDPQADRIRTQTKELFEAHEKFVVSNGSLTFKSVTDLKNLYAICCKSSKSAIDGTKRIEKFINHVKDYEDYMVNKYSFSRREGPWVHSGNPGAISRNTHRVIDCATDVLRYYTKLPAYIHRSIEGIQQAVKTISKYSSISSAGQ